MTAPDPWPPEEVPVDPDDPRIPPAIREAVLERISFGDVLHRVVTDNGIEWWLISDEGEFIDAFWLED